MDLIHAPVEPARRYLGLRLRNFIILIIGLVSIIGVLVGVGVGLTQHHDKTVANDTAPVVNTTIPVVQTSGPIYGSGIVSLDQDNKSKIETCTQDWKGVINLSEYVNGTWFGGKEVGELDTSNGKLMVKIWLRRTPLKSWH